MQSCILLSLTGRCGVASARALKCTLVVSPLFRSSSISTSALHFWKVHFWKINFWQIPYEKYTFKRWNRNAFWLYLLFFAPPSSSKLHCIALKDIEASHCNSASSCWALYSVQCTVEIKTLQSIALPCTVLQRLQCIDQLGDWVPPVWLSRWPASTRSQTQGHQQRSTVAPSKMYSLHPDFSLPRWK